MNTNWHNKFLNFIRDEFEGEKEEEKFLKACLFLFYNLSEEDSSEYMSGLGSKDQGVDAAFQSHSNENEYIIIQSKYHHLHRKAKKKPYLDPAEGHKLVNFEKRVRNDYKFSSYDTNSSILEIVDDIRDFLRNDKNKYITKVVFKYGYTSENINKIMQNEKVICYSEKDIIDKYKEYYQDKKDEIENVNDIDIHNLNEKMEHDEIFELVFTHPHYDNESGYVQTKVPSINHVKMSVLVGFCTAEQLVLMREKIGPSIFKRNIRTFLGPASNVNKDIINTADKAPLRFMAYNNGITITCDEVKMKTKSKNNLSSELWKPRIINGAQTVGSLHYLYNKMLETQTEDEVREHFRTIHVLCKIVQSTKDDKRAFAEEMTTFSNHQNKIYDSYFYSKDKIHEDIEKVLANFLVKYNYRSENIPKRELSSKKRNNQRLYLNQINIRDFAEWRVAQAGLISKAQKSNIFRSDIERTEAYKTAFGDDNTKINQNEFILSYFVGLLSKKIANKISKIVRGNYYNYDPNNPPTKQDEVTLTAISRAIGIPLYNTHISESKEKENLEKIRLIKGLNHKTLQLTILKMIEELIIIDNNGQATNDLKSIMLNEIDNISKNSSENKYSEAEAYCLAIIDMGLHYCIRAFYRTSQRNGEYRQKDSTVEQICDEIEVIIHENEPLNLK